MLSINIAWYRDPQTWEVVMYVPTIYNDLGKIKKWPIETSSFIDTWIRVIVGKKKREIHDIFHEKSSG